MAAGRTRAGREGLEAKVDGLPTGPGVYQFKSDRDAILYIGKAQNLRSRVRQYLSGGDGRMQIPALMERVRDVDVLVTANVKEALLLENELIKRHKPVFNVKLRDDKQYLALRLDTRETWPRLTTVRRFRKDGADYFGPYTSSVALKEALSNLRRLFPLRSCSDAVFADYGRRGRPCIEYEMKRCSGPCNGLAEPTAYSEQVQGTALFLRGRSEELVATMRAQMRAASEDERFEEAARLRDRVAAVENTLQQQQIVSEKSLERDVFGLAREGGEVELQVLHVREGRVVAAEDYAFSQVKLDDGEVMSSFLGQYYGQYYDQYYGKSDEREAPREILCSAAFEDDGALAAWLRERWDRRVEIRSPQRGGIRRLVDIATRNAELALAQRLAARESVEAALGEIAEACGLGLPPQRIECYDVSNLQGSLAVASRVVFEAGLPIKKDYRRYRIKQAAGGDDYDCLREVMGRRLKRSESEPLPDLLMVDGGRGQLGVVIAAVEDAGVVVECVAISKERDNTSRGPRVRRGGGLKAERLFRPGRANPILLAPSSRGLLLLQRVRDESHRFAIEFQRELRSKRATISILEELPGIGPGKRRKLLRSLGSLRAVREASEADLVQVAGISAHDASTIHRFFHADTESPATSEVDDEETTATEAAAAAEAGATGSE
ncbi:MAG: excinuclease ABC subunit UvrC [Deltaproteobacteria bacterium]|nr:excinuclease ABC subunit UvrC [Deltaproteobacteria bacterium]